MNMDVNKFKNYLKDKNNNTKNTSQKDFLISNKQEESKLQ